MNKILTLVSLLYSFSTFGRLWGPVGDNSSTGNLTIGSTVSNTHSKLALRGPNFPHGIESKRDIVFDFAATGEVYIRAYRGTSWGTYLRFMTSDQANTGGVPTPRLHIPVNGNIEMGTPTPVERLNGAIDLQ